MENPSGRPVAGVGENPAGRRAVRVDASFAIKTEKIKNILVRGTNWVGDAVMTLPALAAIRQNFPGARITVLAKPWVQGVYAHCPDIDGIMTFDQQAGFLNSRYYRSRYLLIRQLRNQQFDMAVLLQNAFEAALIAFGAGIPCRVGYNTDRRSWLLTHKVRISEEILSVHQVYYYLGMLESLGWTVKEPAPRLLITSREKEKAVRYLTDKGWQEPDLLLGFNPGAFFGPAKRWLPEYYAAVADRAVQHYGAKCIIFGSTSDLPAAREMASRMQSAQPILSAGETGLEELPGLLSMCSLFITNDSGLMHMAAALGIPVIAIFGSTDPRTTSPYGEEHTVIYRRVPCSPCLRRECPTDHKCMKAVTVDDVWQAVVEKQESRARK
ncbi:MAG: lipopolysaccharide heptosyltransferase II [bacterium]